MLHAYRTASWSAAQGFGLRDRGLISPRQTGGYRAAGRSGILRRKIRAERRPAGGRNRFRGADRPSPHRPRQHENRRRAKQQDFATPASGPSGPVIGIIPGRIVTEHLRLSLADASAINGSRTAAQDVLKVAVVGRHGKNRNIGKAFVKGFGFTSGALASSVGHDSHNICVVGSTDDADMAIAVNRIIALGRRLRGRPKRSMSSAKSRCPIAGLFSLKSFTHIKDELLQPPQSRSRHGLHP